MRSSQKTDPVSYTHLDVYKRQFWRFEGGDGEERQELNGLDIHGPGEADGEVLLSYIVMFHKTRFLDLCRMMKK